MTPKKYPFLKSLAACPTVQFKFGSSCYQKVTVLILLLPSINRSNGRLDPSIDLTSPDRSTVPFDFTVKLFPTSELLSAACCSIPSTKSLPFPRVHTWLLYVSRIIRCFCFQRRLCNAAKKALSKIPTKHIKMDDKVTYTHVYSSVTVRVRCGETCVCLSKSYQPVYIFV